MLEAGGGIDGYSGVTLVSDRELPHNLLPGIGENGPGGKLLTVLARQILRIDDQLESLRRRR